LGWTLVHSLISYQTAYKVGTSRTPSQLVYGLHPLLPTEYMLPSRPGDNNFPQQVKVITSRLSELKKLQENILIT
jgi:hypothetical protein